MPDDQQGTILPEQLSDLRLLAADIEAKLAKLRTLHLKTLDMIKASDVAGAARAYIAIKDVGDRLDAQMTEIHKVSQNLQITVVPEKFQLSGVTSFTVDGHRVTISARLSVTMKDKVGGMQWLQDNNLGDIIQETVNASTLGATIRKMIEDQGIEPPEEFFTVTPVNSTSVTKVKVKAGTL